MIKKNSPLAKLAAASLAALLFSGNAAQADPITRFVQEQQQQQQQQQKVHKLPPLRFVRSRDFDMKHVALDLRFDWDKSQAFGTARVTLAPFKNGTQTIALDQGNLQINSVKTDKGATLAFSKDDAQQKLFVTLDRAYRAGEDLTLVIDYRTGGNIEGGILGGFGGGLKFIKPTPEQPNKPRQIYSQGESEFNRFWFPSYDSPNDFATSEITATVEKPFIVISNGELVGGKPRENKDGTRTFHWRIAAPHANYLTSIVVGEYAAVKGEYNGKPVVSYVYPNELKEGAVTTKRLPATVEFFSRKTGIPYPYEKYAQTMVEDFGGGMENISATTQIREMIHDERAELDGTSDSLQSHELAHQWFGDYVTCREWGQIWLNESFATYFQALWDEESLGHDEFLYRDVRSNQNQYLAAWNRGVRRPVVTQNYEDKDAIFDAYAYPRGGATLHMLRVFLGDDLWWRGIHHYLEQNAHKPVSTEQLRIAFEEATGQSLDLFFNQWLYRMGHPIFAVTQNYDAASKKLILTVRQTQKPDPTWEYPQVEFFDTPVDIEIGTAANPSRIERVRIEPKETNVFTFDVDSKPLLVNFDYQGTLIKEIIFDKSVDELVFQLTNDKDVLGRIWAVEQLGKKYQSENTSTSDKTRIAAALGQAIVSDAFWAVRRDAINQFAAPRQNAVQAFFNNAPAFPIPSEVVAALKTAVRDKEAAVRAAAFDLLGSQKAAANADLFIAALNDPSYNVVDQAADALAQTKSPQAFERLTKLLDEPSWQNRVRIAGLNALATLGDKRAFDIGLKYANDNTQPRPVRAAALGVLAATGKGDSRAFPLVFENFKKSLEANDFQSIFTGFTSIIRLADPRGQQAFDLAKNKFAKNAQIMSFLTILEAQFKNSLTPGK
jgi:aminopeptidase N